MASGALLGALFLAQVAAGVTKTSSWPISVYPTFSVRKVARVHYGQVTHVVLETRDGAHDLALALKRARVVNAGHMVERLRQRATKRRGSWSGRELVLLYRYLGAEAKAGDHVVIVEASWDLFPLGARAGYREEAIRRFEIQDDSTLEVIDPSRPSPLERTAEVEIRTLPAARSPDRR